MNSEVKHLTKKQLIDNIGGLSQTTKMPCHSFNLSAFSCNNGGKLARIQGSVCDGCYAMKGNYVRYKNNFQKAHDRKIKRYTENYSLWVESFIKLLNRKEFIENGYFRWFDSGDIYDYNMLLAVVTIAKNTPKIKHWLPTKEYQLIRQYEKEFGEFPKNLIVRVSAPMVDTILQGQKHTSSVIKDSEFTETKTNKICKAYKQGNECLDCRMCWNKDIRNIGYKYH